MRIENQIDKVDMAVNGNADGTEKCESASVEHEIPEKEWKSNKCLSNKLLIAGFIQYTRRRS